MKKQKIILIGLILSAIVFVVAIFIGKNNSTKTDREITTNQSGNTFIMNTDKKDYITGDEVYFQIASFDVNGKSVCPQNLKITIMNVKSKETKEIPVVVSPSCAQNGPTGANPDLYAFYKLTENGIFSAKLFSGSDQPDSSTEFNVSQQRPVEISISRWGPTKISYESEDRYPMKLTVTTRENFSGQIVESVPTNLRIVWYGPAKIENTDHGQTISWDVTLSKGESKELVYEYSADQIVPNSFKLGPIVVYKDGKNILQEENEWMIIKI